MNQTRAASNASLNWLAADTRLLPILGELGGNGGLRPLPQFRDAGPRRFNVVKGKQLRSLYDSTGTDDREAAQVDFCFRWKEVCDWWIGSTWKRNRIEFPFYILVCGRTLKRPKTTTTRVANSKRVFIPTSLFVLLLCAHSFAAPVVKKLIVEPPSIELRHAGDEHGLLVTAVQVDGSLQDVTAQAKFKTKQPKLIRVTTSGVCSPIADGKAEVLVSFGEKTQSVPVTVVDSSFQPTPSFRQDVLPILTKTGCNAGACHGKLAGQNSFKLSLRGYAPEWDIDWLSKEVHSRRIDYAFPEQSLIISKPLGQVPHEGGVRFGEGSRYHRALTDWILARTPGPDTNETDAARIEVFPGHRTMKPGERQQLLVRAHYNDGRVRDVTWLAQFFSNDETTLSVTPGGVVKGLRNGEAPVRVHFQGQVEVILFTIPYTNRTSPALFAQKNNAIDGPVMAKLQALQIPPSGLCDDATFLRRAFLDTIGALPTVEETRSFTADTRPDKRAKLVDALLQRPEYADFWTLQFADLLQNRKERDHDVRGAKGVRAFHSWLRTQIAANRPWNELARDVLTASGDSVTRPQVGYYVTLVGEKKAEESEITDGVAQAFLGSRIGCAKCHNHPLEKFTQDDYYHFAAFFSRVSMKRVDPTTGATSLVAESKEEAEQKKKIFELEKALGEVEAAAKNANPDEQEKHGKKLAEQQKKLEDATKQLSKLRFEKKPGALQPRTKQMMAPQPLDRSPVHSRPGDDPRIELARWITDPSNQGFSGAMVNRLWKHFMGVGLVEPVDDLRASNPPTNPELWKVLEREFVTHQYDLKHVMRLILNSRTYQLSSDTLPGNQTDRKFFSHFNARRLPAEVMLDAVSTATGVADEFKGYPVGTRAVQLPEPGVSSYFLSLFGRSDRVTACACERMGEVTLPQLLHLQNGDEVPRKIRADDGRLAKLLQEKDDKLMEELFLTTLTRSPRPDELAAVRAALADGSPREDVYRDLFWALLNSKDFAFNH